jgi:hypothetical protein
MKNFAFTLVLFLLALSPLLAATSIHRVLEEDELTLPGFGGGPMESCGWRDRPLKNGDSVRVTVGEQGARRDEPAVSFLFDARAGRLVVADHTERTYSELAMPLKPRVAFPSHARLSEEERKILGSTLEGPVREVPGEGVTTYEGTFISRKRRAAEVSVTCGQGDEAKARTVALLEQAVQQLRSRGSDWISDLRAESCLVLSSRTVTYLPDIQLKRQEKLVKVEEVDASQLVLTPPDGYRKVKYRECPSFP